MKKALKPLLWIMAAIVVLMSLAYLGEHHGWDCLFSGGGDHHGHQH